MSNGQYYTVSATMMANDTAVKFTASSVLRPGEKYDLTLDVDEIKSVISDSYLTEACQMLIDWLDVVDGQLVIVDSE